jgi:hypothetical protein
MNQKTHFTLSFYHLNLSVRDTLEYVQNRKSYPKNMWEAKKNTFNLAFRENSPFNGFCDHNGEDGNLVRNQLKEMYETCYGDEQTFVSFEGDQVKPDHSLNLKVLDYILPLRQSLTNIIRAYLKNQKEENTLEPGVEELIQLDDDFYRIICSMILADLLFNVHFVEFNKAMQETQGKESPQSNFCVNDIKKVIGMFNFIKQNARPDFVEFQECANQMELGIGYISGQPLPEGSSFRAEFDKIIQSWFAQVARLEPVWREKHQFIWGQLVEYERNLQAQQAAAAKTEESK